MKVWRGNLKFLGNIYRTIGQYRDCVGVLHSIGIIYFSQTDCCCQNFKGLYLIHILYPFFSFFAAAFKGWSTIPLESLIELSTTKHLRWHSLELVKHRSSLEVRRNFFTERFINRWNSLDQQSLDANSVNCFKNDLQRLRNTRMGFFVDWCLINPLAAQVHTGVATPGKWPGKLLWWIKIINTGMLPTDRRSTFPTNWLSGKDAARCQLAKLI